MSGYPILSYPNFLSPSLAEYLREISEESGRYFVYIDARQANNPLALAWIETEPDLPAAAIYINVANINPSRYVSEKHDPIFAHEVAHLQLFTQGWSQIAPTETAPADVGEKTKAVQNWLSDPLINERINSRGFSMTENRLVEITGATQAIEQDIWTYNLLYGVPPFVFIRLYVSYCLEPFIPSSVIDQFRSTFSAKLPTLLPLGEAVLSLIRVTGFDTAANYRLSTKNCLSLLGVLEEHFRFGEHQRFSIEEQQRWIEQNIGDEELEKWE